MKGFKNENEYYLRWNRGNKDRLCIGGVHVFVVAVYFGFESRIEAKRAEISLEECSAWLMGERVGEREKERAKLKIEERLDK